MKKVSLSGSPRANVGKKDASDLRKKNQIPCVVYGSGEQISFTALENDLKKIVWNPNVYQIELDIAGKKVNTIMKDIQFHPVNDRVIHVDFLELIPNKAVKVKIPVRLTGTAEGVKKGGKLFQNFRKLSLTATPEKLPDVIEVKVDDLNIGDMIRIKQLKYEGVKFLEAPEAVVAAVKTSRAVAVEDPKAVAPAAGAAAAAPAAAATPAKK